MFSSPLTVIVDQAGSDKGCLHGDRHRYSQLYDVLFSHQRSRIAKVLELGLARGGPEAEVGGRIERHCNSPSVAAWLEYFPQAHIYGFDISDFGHLEAGNPRFHFRRGDCGRAEDLAGLRLMVGDDLDMVIDDASHASYHQQLALRELFPCLLPGGLYIIEDLHWQPRHLEAKLPPVMPTREWLESLRSGTGQLSAIWSESQIRQLANSIASLVILTDLQVPGSRYRNSLALIRKKA